MELNDNEREFIEIYRKAKQDNDTNMIICIYALLDMLLEQQGSPLSGKLNGYTKGQYKRAIKCLRVVQALVLRENRPEMVEDCEQTVMSATPVACEVRESPKETAALRSRDIFHQKPHKPVILLFGQRQAVDILTHRLGCFQKLRRTVLGNI